MKKLGKLETKALDMLNDNEFISPSDLSRETGQAFQNCSSALRRLLDLNLVESFFNEDLKDHRLVCYRIRVKK